MTNDVYERRKAILGEGSLEALFPNLDSKVVNAMEVYQLVSDEGKKYLEALRGYMESPAESFSEFLEGNPEQIRGILASDEFVDELRSYIGRIQNNERQGLEVTIHPKDIYEFMRFSFTRLDDRKVDDCSGLLPPPHRGRRVYTGQTEQPGSNFD